MTKQLTNISEAFDQMIEDAQHNQSKIKQRKNKLEQYHNQILLNNNILQIAVQRASNEVEDQIYHLNERLKIQLLDEVKSIYNGQMTQSNNIFKSKHRKTNSIFRKKQISIYQCD